MLNVETLSKHGYGQWLNNTPLIIQSLEHPGDKDNKFYHMRYYYRFLVFNRERLFAWPIKIKPDFTCQIINFFNIRIKLERDYA
jgi:hypothetical protein